MPAKKGAKRAKPEGEERFSGGGYHRKHMRCMQLDAARDLKRLNALRAQLDADKAKFTAELDARRAALDAREKALAAREKSLDKREAEIDAKAARGKRREEKLAAKAKAKEVAREEARMSRCLASFPRPPAALCAALPTASSQQTQQTPMEALDAEAEKLKHTMGMITTESQSRCILLLVIHFVRDGAGSSEATTKVSKLLHVGETKVKAVRRAWKQHGVLLSRSGKGRGSVKGQGDKRLALNATAAAGGGGAGDKRPALNAIEGGGDVDDEETGAEFSSDDDDSWQSDDEVMPLSVV